ncbi:MAG: hypothetical protein RLZZ592_1889, partial [Pseudomonadota bacterium]
MSLRARLGATPSFTPSGLAPLADVESTVASRPDAYQAIKVQVHQSLLQRIDLSTLEGLPRERLREELRLQVERQLVEDNLVLNAAERRQLVSDVQDEMLGHGPLEPLLADPTISDILVNSASQIYVERGGRLTLTEARFADDAHLMKVIDRIVSRV